MANIEKLIDRQTELGGLIDRLLINFGKDPKVRKTPEYLASKLETLEDYWLEFEKNDDTIRDSPTVSTDNQYFTKEYYMQVELAYMTLKEKIGVLEKEKIEIQKPVPEKRAVEVNNTNTKLRQLGVSLQSAMTTLASILANVESSQWQSTSVVEHIISRIEKFQNIITTKESEILQVAGENELPYSQDEFQELQSRAEDALIQLQMKINQAPSSIPNVGISIQPSVKLTQISIPKFDGDRAKWHQFHDLFNQLVHQQEINKALKMFYLKDNLKGEAEQVIRHLMVTDANYDAAWTILKNKYDDKRALVNSWLKRIVNQKPVNHATTDDIKKLHDNVREATLALDSLNIPAREMWEAMVLYLTADKLDNTSKTLYEQSLQEPQELQSLETFVKFLHTRYRSLNVHVGDKPKQIRASMMTAKTDYKLKCPICTKDHAIYYCEQFLKMNDQARKDAAYKAKLCVNCLKLGHFANKCSSRTCAKCNKRHNTLLHSAPSSTEPAAVVAAANMPTSLSVEGGGAILGTALVHIKDADNNWVQCRALLDPGSQVHIATEKLQRKLRLDGSSVNSRIAGLGESRITVNNKLYLVIRSRTTNFSTSLEALVMKTITSIQPQRHISIKKWNIPNNIKLADPRFNIPQGVDLLLGVQLYGELILPRQIKLGAHMPTLQDSTLGWLIMGAVRNISHQDEDFCGIGSIDLDDQIKKFWELEEYIPRKRFTAEEMKCEALFDATTSRKDGRFEVKIPLLRSPAALGESQKTAYIRLMHLEKKFKHNTDLKEQYVKFLKEYEQQGHMEEVLPVDIQGPHYYMPHHCVLKPSSSTTKLRVVFDASAKTTNNISLNEIMMAGPRVQDELFAIILRFRSKRYVFTADIQQMYRQILVAKEDRNLQLILWRENDDMPVRTFRLCTVTYGTKSAPFLATKCLQRLAEDEDDKFPLGAKATRDFYVDDIITGANDIAEAIEIQKQLRQLLGAGGFRLRKWCANHPRLLENLNSQDMELQLDFNKDDGWTKPLGLTWHPVSDHFQITVNLKPHTSITKRSILSNTATLFDPLGLVNPVIVSAKIFMQRLWKLNVDWDEKLSIELQEEWKRHEDGLKALHDLRLPRYMLATENTGRVILHAFTDASERAYGTAVYVRSQDKSGEVVVRLLCARSRVAPLKQTKLPLLELCAAKMAAEVVKTVTECLSNTIDNVYYWSDSEIVLSWLNRDAATLKTFVANRVADIQSLSDVRCWKYVPSQQNPADLVSRGCTAPQLLKEKRWFSGPDFLRKPQANWPKQDQKQIMMKEFDRTLKCILTTSQPEMNLIECINHGNSFLRLQRLMALILRATQRFKLRAQGNKTNSDALPVITAEELHAASLMIFCIVQKSTYLSEIHCITNNQPLPRGSNLAPLAPFIDNTGLLRVGGRLQQSSLSYDEQHPILLPSTHFVTRLYMAYVHVRHLHAGPQALTAITRQRVWIPQGRQLARSIVNSCIRCVRARPLLASQMMGQLPYHRVTQARPFINCGVDFCGPVWTHFKVRGKRPVKTYIAVFCCFSTKAVHLEVVSDLTSDSFIGSLKRFISRRGFCKNIYCDNATNFVGAYNRISDLQNIVVSNEARDKILNYCAEGLIHFHFIPPRAPHMGGLWEAAVKSAKYLLWRTVSSASLTYEELSTVTCEIEAVLNSRPITPMSSDPSDFNALTPGHFLIGEPMTATIDPQATHATMSLLTRWQLVSFCRAEFWKRWSVEYLTTLQQRAKWVKEYPNMMTGTLVLIKEDNLPPLQWSLGRVTDLVMGPDGHARVADIRTPTGTIRRPIHNLAPLPIEINDDEQPSNENSAETESVQPVTADDNQGKNKRRKSNKGISLTTALIVLLCFCFPLVAATHVKVQKLEHNAGLFYNPKGKCRLSPTHWTIMAYVKLDRFQAMEGEIETALLRMKTIADKLVNAEPYTDTIKYFEGQIARAKQYNKVLLYDPAPRSRSKRAAINLVGTVFNKMFGLLDEEYAQTMKNTIDNVQTNENLLKKLLDNHTSILDTTLNVFKRDREDILKQTLQLKRIIQTDYVNLNNKIEKETSERKSVEMLNLLATLVTSYLREYNMVQDTIADISFGLVQGHTSLHVITPEQLQEQLNLISQKLPSSLVLPLTDRVDLRPLYRVMATHGQVSGNVYLFKIQIPLLSENEFQLYQLIPLPVIVNDTQMRIEVTVEYLAVDLRRNQFYALKEYELEKCIIFTAEVHICHQTRPIEDENNGPHQCEAQLMLARTLPRVCTIAYSHPHNTWTRIGITGTWLFTVMTSYDITVICQDGISERMTIEDSGILSLDKGCTMRAKNLTLTSHQELTTTFNFITQPQFNLSHFGGPTQTTTERLPADRFTIDVSLERNISVLHEQLNKVKEDQTELKQLQPHDVHQYATSYTALCLAAVISIYLAYRIWTNKKKKKLEAVRDGAQFVLRSLQQERPEDVQL